MQTSLFAVKEKQCSYPLLSIISVFSLTLFFLPCFTIFFSRTFFLSASLIRIKLYAGNNTCRPHASLHTQWGARSIQYDSRKETRLLNLPLLLRDEICPLAFLLYALPLPLIQSHKKTCRHFDGYLPASEASRGRRKKGERESPAKSTHEQKGTKKAPKGLYV